MNGEWREIASAPKDGSEIILGRKGWSGAGFWDDEHDQHAGWYNELYRRGALPPRPLRGVTHWMPLPQPPK